MSKKNILSFLWPLGLALVLVFFLTTAFLERWQNQITDSFYADREASSKIVIVEIDDESIQKIGAWPWNRKVFGDVVGKLSEEEARIVGFDVVFAESREGDEEFHEALANSTNEVVLAGKVIGEDFLFPLEKFISLENVQYGYANFTPDRDGKVRNAKLFSEEQGICHPSLSYQILELYFSSRNELTCELGARKLGFSDFTVSETGIRINYLKQSGGYKSVSVNDLLSGNYEPGLFKDKIVLIGSTAQDVKSGLNDNLVSPTDGNFIPGVEIHANTLQTVIEDEFIYELPIGFKIVALILAVFVAYFVARKLKVVHSAILIFVGLIIYMILTFLLFDLGYIADFIYLPVGAFLAWLLGVGWKYYERRTEVAGLRRAFSRYVNKKLLTQILADPSRLKLGGDKKEMTVLFSDIRGFTSISEKLDPEELVGFLNNYFNRVTKNITENNGVVDKFLGDAVMAFWGAPIDDEQHSYNACKAIVGLMYVLDEFNKEKGLPAEINVGVGVNSGEMVVGNMGSEDRFDYTVLGDNVNLASRLEGLTKKYAVTAIVTEATISYLTDEQRKEFNFRKLDMVQVKGKNKPAAIYELMRKGNKEIITKYEEALILYEKGEFKKAKVIFDSLRKEFNDGPSIVMSARCEELLKMKPDKWNGVWVWLEK